MLIVRCFEDQFHIQSGDGNRTENIDYVFTEDIDWLAIHQMPAIHQILDDNRISQFRNVEIRRLAIPSVNFAHRFVQLHPGNIPRIYINAPISDLAEFVLVNSMANKDVKIIIQVNNIEGLTSDHFINEYIFYEIVDDGPQSDIKLVLENAKNIICNSDISFDNVDLQKCVYNNFVMDFYSPLDYDDISRILDKITVKTFESYVSLGTGMTDMLAKVKIPNIVLKGTNGFMIVGEEGGIPVLDIDPLLKNPVIESIKITNKDVTYTKELLESNHMIKELVITGPECDQEFIAEICEANKYGIRYLRTKSARSAP